MELGPAHLNQDMPSRLRILIVGSWMWPWYEQACANSLESLGWEVERLGWFSSFYRSQAGSVEPLYRSLSARIQNRLLFGPILWKFNARLLTFALKMTPDVIFFYNSTHVYSAAIRSLRRSLPGTALVQYSNDNPFQARLKPDYWRHLKRAIPFFSVHFVYRKSNEPDFLKYGARSVHLLRSYYVPEDDYRVSLDSGDVAYQSDVVFAGHFEPDGRLEMLEAIGRQGYRLNLFGGGWSKARGALAANSPLLQRYPVTPVLGNDYRKAISGSKIALSFLSKLNADTYTRRNFQIPAMSAFMLSEYSDDLASLFKEGVEAEYFRSCEELLDKIRFYLNDDSAREKVARNGYRRVVEDGHDVKSRMRTFLNILDREKTRRWLH
jgi:spore maturation protein CgeB